MAAKKSLSQMLESRTIHRPPFVIYRILMLVTRVLNLKVHTTFTYKARPGEEKGAFVLIANHASRNDYLFTAPAALPRHLNYVVGYNEFFRFPLGLLLKFMQVIPKKNFTPDTYAIRQIMRVIKRGDAICIMPEGMSSITGMAQPVIPGGAKLLKSLGVPVYFSKISGAYMTYTKHCLDERPGRCEVVVDRMFTAEELKSLSVAEIEDRMNRLLAHDDYIWNKKARVAFKGKGQMARQLDTLLYLCPKCGAMHRMRCSGNEMKCEACGNTIRVNEFYDIEAVGEGSVCPPLVTDWTILERKHAGEMVRQPGFSYSEKVKIGVLPEHKRLKGDETSRICGEGQLTLTAQGLSFEGTKEGKPYSFRIPCNSLPTYGMCTDISRFYTFINGYFVEFYPQERNDVLLWDHLTEEMHRFTGGKWQNTRYRHIDEDGEVFCE